MKVVALDGLPSDLDLRAAASWDRTRHDEEAVLGINLQDFEILYGDALAAHAATHAHTLDHAAARASAAADRTRLTLGVLLTVGASSAGKSMTLHDALKSFRLRDA